MISFLYNIVLLLFKPVYFLYYCFNGKFREREKSAVFLTEKYKEQLQNKTGKRIWFHASSMGEFEQAKPVIEMLKENNPEIEIICTFFSPSGLENQKNYKFADYILYFPFDFKSRIKSFISLIQPDIAVFVRYEIWRNALEQLKNKKIEILLICATYPGSGLLAKFPFLYYTKSNYNFFSAIYSFNKEHYQLFLKMKLSCELAESTDTRYDRILRNVENAKSFELLPPIKKDLFTIVCGSTWEPDEKLIYNAYLKIKEKYDLMLIIVPHEPYPEHITKLREKFGNSVLLSEVTREPNKLSDSSIIIVDSIGKLLKLYKYADIAYVGGAFGVGVHSVSEPAGYGLPICCGTYYQNSPDAVVLNEIGALTAVDDANELEKWITGMIDDSELREKCGKLAFDYLDSRKGTSLIIYETLIRKLEQKISS